MVHDSVSILFEVFGNQRSRVRSHIVLIEHTIIADVWMFPRDVHTKGSQDLVVMLFINSRLQSAHVLIHHASVIEEGNQLHFPS